MTDPLGDLARQLPAMVDLGQVQETTAIDALAELASGRAGHLRETALRLQPAVGQPDRVQPAVGAPHPHSDVRAEPRRPGGPLCCGVAPVR